MLLWLGLGEEEGKAEALRKAYFGGWEERTAQVVCLSSQLARRLLCLFPIGHLGVFGMFSFVFFACSRVFLLQGLKAT